MNNPHNTTSPFTVEQTGDVDFSAHPIRRGVPVTIFRTEEDPQGVIPIAYQLSKTGKVIGIGIAANAARPCGGLGSGIMSGTSPVTDVRKSAQEEHVTSNWLLSTFGTEIEAQQLAWWALQAFWGLIDLTKDSTDTRTVQGVDYTRASPSDYRKAWRVVETQQLSAIRQGRRGPELIPDSTFPAKLVFGVGPNTNRPGDPTRGMARTWDPQATADYSHFQASQREALTATLDAMIESGVQVALVPLLSCGVYSKGLIGISADRVCHDYLRILDQVLKERVGPRGETRAQYFDDVIVPEFPGFAQRVSLGSASASASPAASASASALASLSTSATAATGPIDNETRLAYFRNRLFWRLKPEQKGRQAVKYLDKVMAQAIREGKRGTDLIGVLDGVRGLGDFIRSECRTAIKFGDAGSDGCSKCRARGQPDGACRSHLDSECRSG
jgi:hypothetical protein